MLPAAPILVFGGTFDPPHRVHAAMASAAADALGADTILVIPARVNPQRTSAPPAGAEDRRAMAAIAFRREPRAVIDPVELEREGPSWTVDTLRHLHRLHPGRTLRLLVGSDQALNFHTWRESATVEALAEPAVVLRAPATEAAWRAALEAQLGAAGAARWAQRLLPVPPAPAASTDVRAALREERPVTGMLDPEVEAYVRRRGLYGAAP
ncbi:MAG: nicotinate (nicotinamide) nucleotide adenylyltransferase [Phycisphaerales bacterium]